MTDTATHRRGQGGTVGVRPNGLALAPDGRLFFACAGDNTVHFIPTSQLENGARRPVPSGVCGR